MLLICKAIVPPGMLPTLPLRPASCGSCQSQRSTAHERCARERASRVEPEQQQTEQQQQPHQLLASPRPDKQCAVR